MRGPRAGRIVFAVLVAIIVLVLVVGVLASTRDGDSAASPRPTPTPSSATTAAPASTTTVPAPHGLSRVTIAEVSHADAYERDFFGDWIDVDGDCQNTRAEVLIAESLAPVTFTSPAHCSVAAGSWDDPWTAATTTIAQEFDVDHTVPLANAWRSGAWAWPPARRIAFANDLTDPNHLNAMDRGANRAKGDDGPDAWRPPDRATWCDYAIGWSRIKARWQLSATPAEWDALTDMARTC
jgi:hypothetical protein